MLSFWSLFIVSPQLIIHPRGCWKGCSFSLLGSPMILRAALFPHKYAESFKYALAGLCSE